MQRIQRGATLFATLALVAVTGSHAGCLPSHDGYLKARIRGAIDLDVDLNDAELECQGGSRAEGGGIRLSLGSSVKRNGHRVQMLFGVGPAREGRNDRNLPTNLTVIFEGEQRLFGTRGAEQCTLERMTQQRLPGSANRPRTYRVVARGFCVGPASALNGRERILVSEFDFAGLARFDEPLPAAPAMGRSKP